MLDNRRGEKRRATSLKIMFNHQLVAFLSQALFALPIAMGIAGAATNIGQMHQLICKKPELRDVSCYHQKAYLFGVWSLVDEPFTVKDATVEKYRLDQEADPFVGYRLALVTTTGKSFFYYGLNEQQAYLDLERLRNLLRDKGSASLELRNSLPLIGNLFLLLLLLFATYMGVILTKFIIFYLLVPILDSRENNKMLYVAICCLPVTISVLFVLNIVQSEQLSCKRIEINSVLCERRITYLFGMWSNRNELKVQQATVKENYSELRNGADTTYGLLLITPDHEICYGCYYINAHQAYSSLNEVNEILSGSRDSTLELNYEQSWITQLLKLVLGLAFIPFSVLVCELCAFVPVIGLLGVFSKSGYDDNR